MPKRKSRGSQDSASSSNSGEPERDELFDKTVGDVVFYFLTASKDNAVVKRADLCKRCNMTGKPKGYQDHVIAAAACHLKETLDIRVKEFADKAGLYVLLNEAPDDPDNSVLTFSDEDNCEMGLTVTILGLILMNKGRVTDETLFGFLEGLGFSSTKNGLNVTNGEARPNILSHDFNLKIDVKRFVNEILVSRRHYLKRERVKKLDGEDEVYEYEWGDQAKATIKKSAVFKFVCQIYECDHDSFQEQRARIVSEEGEQALQDEAEEVPQEKGEEALQE